MRMVFIPCLHSLSLSHLLEKLQRKRKQIKNAKINPKLPVLTFMLLTKSFLTYIDRAFCIHPPSLRRHEITRIRRSY